MTTKKKPVKETEIQPASAAEVEAAAEDAGLAGEVGYVGVTEIARGAAQPGAAESAG